jgi:hypothetical protein
VENKPEELGMKNLALGVLFSVLGTCASVGYIPDAKAATIPYPSVGTPNPATYNFTAAYTGDIVVYFAGSTASYTEVVGVEINGVSTGILGLNDHTSALGQSLNLGHATAGDTLTFFDVVSDIGLTWYSNPTLNADGGNHVYSTSAAAGQACSSCPAGTYVAFEDLDFRTGSDYNYFDDTFVFTNVTSTNVSSTPLPSTWTMLLAGFCGLGFFAGRGTRSLQFNTV